MAGLPHCPYLGPHPEVYVIYRVTVPLPITIQWCSCIQTLRIAVNSHPPNFALHFDSPGRGGGIIYALQSVEHGEIIVREGFKVRAPGVLDTFLSRLVRERRANVLAGRHCEVWWSSHFSIRISATHPESDLDAFWTWRRWPNSTPEFDMHGKPRPLAS